MEFMRRHMGNVRCGYLALLAVYAILREVIPFREIVGAGVLTYGFFGLGMLIVAASVVTDRQYLRVFNVPVMALFLAACVLSTLVNCQYAFLDNVKAICWMAIFFFLVYPSGRRSAERDGRELTVVFAASVITMAVLMLISLPMYFLTIDLTYHNENILGVISSQGFSREYMRLWGVFGDANTAAVYAAVTSFMAGYLFVKHKNKLLRVLLAIAMVLYFTFIILSGSRTAYVAGVAALVWLSLYGVLAGKKIHTKRVLSGLLCAVLAAGIGVGAIFGARAALPYAKDALRASVQSATVQEIHELYASMYRWGQLDTTSNFVPGVDYEAPVEKLNRNDLEGKEPSNGRFDKWMGALEIFRASPVVGASPRGAAAFGKVHRPDNEISQLGAAAHNFLLEILMGTGLIGFMLALILLLRGAKRVLNLMVAEPFSWETMLIGAVALNLVCASMFLSDLFFMMTFGSFAFWYALGAVSREPKQSGTTRKVSGKKHILVYGPKDPVGGVETIVFAYVRKIVQEHPDITFDFLAYGSNFSLEPQLQALGCRVLYVPSRKKNFFAYKRAMAKIFVTTPYLAVWGNYSGLTNIDLLVLAKKYGVPVRIAHSHSSRLYWGSAAMKYVVYVLHFYNKLFRLRAYATEFWACSDVAGHFMFPREVREKLVLIPNGVDAAKFYPDRAAGIAAREALGIRGDVPVVGHVARLCQVKNQGFLLRVMAEIRKRNPDAKLLLVGDGELRDQLREQIQKLGLENDVILTGNREDVPELLRAMDVFVLTSFSEGLSVSAVEAQASGLPCVVPTTVSMQTDLTGFVTFLSLDAPAAEWAETILKAASAGTTGAQDKLAAKGYDLAGGAERLYRQFTAMDSQ